MLFIQPAYFVLLAIVLVGYWTQRNVSHRKLWLLAASYVFYSWWDWRLTGLLLLSTAIDHQCALGIGRLPQGHPRRKRLVLVSILGNLAILGTFKYFDFFVQSLVDSAALIGFEADPWLLAIVLPPGISFYTFQSMAYTIDVYDGRVKARRSLLDVALFVAFFPQLVAGPILRAKQFMPQLDRRHRLADVPISAAALLFVIGFWKKAVFADSLALFTDPVWASPELYDRPTLLFAAWVFHIQLFCDFSGYSDMAIASAALLGFRVPRNFAAPLLAHNLTEFWRRWNITLMQWFRDYVYLRLPVRFRYINIVFTAVLIGLWHGAAWTFALFGLVQGLGLAALAALRRSRLHLRVPYVAGVILTGAFLSLANCFFRAESIDDSAYILSALAGVVPAGAQSLGAEAWAALALLVIFYLSWTALRVPWRLSRLRAGTAAAVSGVLLALACAAMPPNYQPFVYFQF